MVRLVAVIATALLGGLPGGQAQPAAEKEYNGMKIGFASVERTKEHEFPDAPIGKLTARPGMELIVISLRVTTAASGNALGCRDFFLEAQPADNIYCADVHIENKPVVQGRHNVIVRFILPEGRTVKALKLGQIAFDLAKANAPLNLIK